MGLDNLLSESPCLVLSDEEVAIWLTFLGDTLGGVILEEVLGEHVDWVILVVGEIVWDFSVVSINPLPGIMIISNESIVTGIKTSKVV